MHQQTACPMIPAMAYSRLQVTCRHSSSTRSSWSRYSSSSSRSIKCSCHSCQSMKACWLAVCTSCLLPSGSGSGLCSVLWQSRAQRSTMRPSQTCWPGTRRSSCRRVLGLRQAVGYAVVRLHLKDLALLLQRSDPMQCVTPLAAHGALRLLLLAPTAFSVLVVVGAPGPQDGGLLC